jgi:hypothetical protein
MDRLHHAYQKQFAIYKDDREAATELLDVGQTPRDEDLAAADHAAMTAVCLGILNLDEALTRE